jgi:zinc-binding alcohol dehydrogenase family protein
MRAIGFLEPGGPEVLRFVKVPQARPGPRDVVVRVRAVSVNPVDTKVRRGLATSAPAGTGGPVVIGWDASGTVDAVGSEARRFRVGDEVYLAGDIGRPGTCAEYVAVDERLVGRKPRTLTFEAAAAMPLTTLTAWEAFVELMGVGEGAGAGRPALVLGGAGGVGSIAIQLAKRVLGLTVVATASRPDGAAFCRQMGADHVLDHTRDLAAQLPVTGLAGIDYVLSCAERPDFRALGAMLSFDGVVACILPARDADLSPLFRKRGRVAFEWMFARARAGVAPERQGAILDRAAELLDQKVLVSTLTQVLDWREHRAAHEAIESGHTVGKIVLRVSA